MFPHYRESFIPTLPPSGIHSIWRDLFSCHKGDAGMHLPYDRGAFPLSNGTLLYQKVDSLIE